MRARIALFAAFAGTVVAANWALGRYGIVPIGFGLYAPAGVYFAGLAFGLRDALHERGGARWVLAAIGVGGLISYVIEDADTIPGGLVPIAVASAVAFTVSELADLAVYAPATPPPMGRSRRRLERRRSDHRLGPVPLAGVRVARPPRRERRRQDVHGRPVTPHRLRRSPSP